MVLRELALNFLSPGKQRFNNIATSHLATAFDIVEVQTIDKEPVHYLEFRNNLDSLVQSFDTRYNREVHSIREVPTCNKVQAISRYSDQITKMWNVDTLAKSLRARRAAN